MIRTARVFPARAEMIRKISRMHILTISIPRESGDDPQERKNNTVATVYSPRERG